MIFAWIWVVGVILSALFVSLAWGISTARADDLFDYFGGLIVGFILGLAWPVFVPLVVISLGLRALVQALSD